MENSENIKIEKKYTIWKFFGILFLVAAISVGIAFPLNNFLDPNTANINSTVTDYVSRTIINSLYKEDSYYNLDNFDYFVKSYKVKYYDSLGNKIPDDDIEKRLEFKEKKEKLISQGLNPSDFMTSEDLKIADINKRYETFYINKENNREIDPESISSNEDTIFAISGSYSNGNLKTDIETSSDEYLYTRKLKDEFLRRLSNNFSQDNELKNIINLRFYYKVDLNSPAYMQMVKDAERPNYYAFAFSAVIVNFILMFLVSIFLKYKKMMDCKEIKNLFSLPIEAVIVLFFMFLFGSFPSIEPFANNIIPVEYSIGIFSVLSVIANVIISLCVNYVVLAIKSFHYDGADNLLLKNSLIRRLFSGVFANIGNAKNQEDLSRAKKRFFLAYMLILFLGLMYMLVFMSPYSHMRFLTFFLYFLVFSLIYILLSKAIDEIGRINIESTKIVKGDFDYNIQKHYRVFDNIIDNFNSIGLNLDKAVEEGIKSQKMKTELITNVSHDLKTPLTSIINYSDLLNKDSSNSQKAKEYSKIIYDKSLRLKTLIEDLFEVSKASSENIQLNLEKIDFKALILQAMGEWEDKFKEKNIEFVSTLPENPLILDLDGQKISRVLDNIFSNIYKYGAEHSRVYIDLISDNKVKLFVKNISKYPLNISAEELMERFTRGDKSRNTEGSGLGLSIADSLINAHKGEFHIEIDGDLFKTIIIL